MTARNFEEHSDEAEMRQLKNLVEQRLGLRLDNIVKSGSSANMTGIQSDHILFSRRLDSRTFFLKDDRYGTDNEAGIFTGAPAEHLELGRMILKNLEIPTSEILDEKVLEEKIQTAQLQNETSSIRFGDLKKGRNWIRFSRQIDNFPVWSSSSIFGFTKEKQIGFMQVHWPEIPQHTVKELHRLAYKLQYGWSPPKMQGASVESVEAGIIHSPAIAFFMDIYPVIRVVYRSDNMSVGRKPVLYLDRDAKNVPLPREIEWKKEEQQQRPTPSQRDIA
jgi:hypothetical protein